MYLRLLKKSKHTHSSHVIPTLFREGLKKYLNKVIISTNAMIFEMVSWLATVYLFNSFNAML